MLKAAITVGLLGATLLANEVFAEARKMVNRRFGFTIELPVTCNKVADSLPVEGNELYYDTTVGVILMISERESRFSQVDDYLNCGMRDLQNLLRYNYGDSTLTLLSCNKPVRYAKKTNVLHFKVSVLPLGFNSYIIYFIHHRHADIQFSFTYRSGRARESVRYIEGVMNTLVLK